MGRVLITKSVLRSILFQAASCNVYSENFRTHDALSVLLEVFLIFGVGKAGLNDVSETIKTLGRSS